LLVPALLLGVSTVTASAGPAKRSAASCDRAQFRIALDVGHTADSPGAKSARGADEFDFNRHQAKAIERKLLDMGFGRTVLMVTKGGARKSLVDRVARANASKADVFLSIHHDSVPDKFAQTWEYEGKKQQFSDRFPGHSIFVSTDNPDYQSSLLFAAIIGKELKARGLKYTPHYTDPIMGHRMRLLVDSEAGVYRYDQLIVLRKTAMPAVLLEVGSIINRNEELVLLSPERHKLVAAAVGEAVDRYCQLRPPQAPTPVAKHEGGENGKPAIRPASVTERTSRAAVSQ
jgi:N-acetylmuramoyl-L-alanine amidase